MLSNPLPSKFLWTLTLGVILVTSIGTFARILECPYAVMLLITGLILLICNIILIIRDIVLNDITNKAFWIITMLVFPPVTSIFYLLQRDEQIK
ncbi:PLDc N-terminal domain-containing protein [Saccharicrinis sp. FJH54]|uniref:PLDc N-terminal domain-containing protein n=1 Tax=Saccharicrinis sp. FJH54 TaxID=3344665 RepID=UPI0035D3F295